MGRSRDPDKLVPRALNALTADEAMLLNNLYVMHELAAPLSLLRELHPYDDQVRK